jgi:hypothetical protein
MSKKGTQLSIFDHGVAPVEVFKGVLSVLSDAEKQTVFSTSDQGYEHVAKLLAIFSKLETMIGTEMQRLNVNPDDKTFKDVMLSWLGMDVTMKVETKKKIKYNSGYTNKDIQELYPELIKDKAVKFMDVDYLNQNTDVRDALVNKGIIDIYDNKIFATNIKGGKK